MHPPRTSPDPSALLQPSRGLASSPRSSRSSGSLLSRLLLGASARRSHTHTQTGGPPWGRAAGGACNDPADRPAILDGGVCSARPAASGVQTGHRECTTRASRSARGTVCRNPVSHGGAGGGMPGSGGGGLVIRLSCEESGGREYTSAMLQRKLARWMGKFSHVSDLFLEMAGLSGTTWHNVLFTSFLKAGN